MMDDGQIYEMMMARYGKVEWEQQDRWIDMSGWKVWRNNGHHTSKTRPINDLDPHYTNDAFRDRDHLVWGSATEECSWDYSDRLWQWDYEAAKNAGQIANDAIGSGCPRGSALYFEKWLSAYFGKPIELVGLITGVNRATGYSYKVYGYREVGP